MALHDGIGEPVFSPDARERNAEIRALMTALVNEKVLDRTAVLASLETIKAFGRLYLSRSRHVEIVEKDNAEVLKDILHFVLFRDLEGAIQPPLSDAMTPKDTLIVEAVSAQRIAEVMGSNFNNQPSQTDYTIPPILS